MRRRGVHLEVFEPPAVQEVSAAFQLLLTEARTSLVGL